MESGASKKVEAQYAELRNALMYAYGVLQEVGGFGVVLNSITYALRTLDYEEMFEAAEDVLEAITSKGGSDKHPELLKVLDKIATGIQATNMMAGPLVYAMLKRAGIWEDCPDCKGKGKIDDKACSICDGKGYVKYDKLEELRKRKK
jgi:RecJ-like exonuclease